MVSRILWMLSVITIPLLMLRYYRFNDIPLTNVFVILASILNLRSIFKPRVGKVEAAVYLMFLLFILISIFDLIRLENEIDYFFQLKAIVLLVTIKLYSYFMYKYSFDFFLKCLTISSGVVLIPL